MRFFRAKTVPMKTWIKDVVRSQNEVVVSPLGDRLPAFPPDALQIATTGRYGELAIQQAAFFYEDAMQAVVSCGESVKSDWKLLDFGSGWGRITRLALRDFKLSNIKGIDVDDDLVALSNDLFGAPTFSACKPLPPTDVASDSTHLILAYSVFSHLSEDAAKKWLNEFARMLKPRQFLVFTSRDISFLDYCRQLAAQRNDVAVSSYQDKLVSTFPADQIDEMKDAYARGEFIFRGIGGGGVRDGSFYGEAFMPRGWIEREFADKFEVIRADIDGTRYDQFCFALRKK